MKLKLSILIFSAPYNGVIPITQLLEVPICSGQHISTAHKLELNPFTIKRLGVITRDDLLNVIGDVQKWLKNEETKVQSNDLVTVDPEFLNTDISENLSF